MAISNADFPQYKESFLKDNTIHRGWVLVRRVSDNILSVCRKDHVDQYNDHVIEPFEAKETAPTKSKPGPKAKAKETLGAGEVDPNAEEA
jgi:hypothetical protein